MLSDTSPPVVLSVTAPPITSASNAPETVEVVYNDDTAVDITSVNNNNIAVSGPGQSSLNVSVAKVTPSDVSSPTETVDYSVAAPSGGWSFSNSGNYTISLGSSPAADTSQNPVGSLNGGFNVAVADTTAPTAQITAPNISSAGGTTQTVTIVFSDPTGINTNTINTGDITVTGPGSGGGNLAIERVTTSGSGNTVTATYTVDAPGPAWDSTDNGQYTVTLQPNQVLNSQNVPAASATAKFTVNVPAPAAPTASISAPDITAAGGKTQTVTIVYSDPTGIDTRSIDTGNITVTGPGSSGSNLAINKVTTSGSGTSVTATYTIDAPGAAWDNTDDGQYTITLLANQVQNADNISAASASAKFTVNISAPAAPTASISAPDINVAGGTTQTVTIVYAASDGVSAGTISTSNITVSGPGSGAGNLAIEKVTTSGSGNSITATYTVDAPGAAWDDTDDGQYTITLLANQVQNTDGIPAASSTANFNVNIPSPIFAKPTASIAAPNVTAVGANNEVIVVTYTSTDSNIAAGSIGVGDMTVTGPAGALTVASVVASPTAPTVTGTYIVNPPAGGWVFADNGTYTVSIKANQVRDQLLQFVAATSATFTVAIAAPDTTPPTATLTSAPGITAVTTSPEVITFTYQDNVAVNTSSIKTNNLIITGPTGAAVTVAAVQIQGSGARVVAVYDISPPGGSWTYLDNGSYSIVLRGGDVTDTSGNGVPIVTGKFTVNVPLPDTTPPAGAFTSAPSITTGSSTPEKITIQFTDNVAVKTSTIAASNLSVTGPTGAATVTGVSITGSGTSVTATYSIAAPGGAWAFADNGTYTVTLLTGKVTDTSGNPAPTIADTFAVNVPPPKPTDDDFNSGAGINTTFVAEAITALSNGDIIVVGQQGSFAAGNSQAVIEELNSDGSVNTSFGKNGFITDSASLNDSYYAVAAQGTKFITGGTENGLFALARYSATGTLDTTFGSGGRVTASFGSAGNTIRSFAFAPGGDIVAVGSAGSNFAFAEFDGNGHLVSGFGSNGLIQFNSAAAGTDTDVLGNVAVASSGQIFAAGADGANVAVIELNSNGSADASFGTGGLVVLNSGAGELFANNGKSVGDPSVGLALQSDGTLLVADHSNNNDMAMVHLLANGSVDTTFGGTGTAIADFGGIDDADAILLEPTGQIIVVGTSTAGGITDAAIAAFNSTGSLISTFGTSGLLPLPAGGAAGTVIHSFGSVTSNGQLLIGTTAGVTDSASSATIHRIIVPGASAAVAESVLGTFGNSGKKNVKLVRTLADGTQVTFTLKGGTGTALLDGNDIHLTITASGGALTITTKGGTGRVGLADVTVTGSLKNIVAKTADLSGTLWATGTLGAISIGNVTGTIAASSTISSITATTLTNAFILAGANLGADAELGGGDDTYAFGFIGTLKVTGPITDSTIAAGIAPTSGDFATPSANFAGQIKSITAPSADATTRFIASSIKAAKLPKKIVVTTDPRFIIA